MNVSHVYLLYSTPAEHTLVDVSLWWVPVHPSCDDDKWAEIIILEVMSISRGWRVDRILLKSSTTSLSSSQ